MYGSNMCVSIPMHALPDTMTVKPGGPAVVAEGRRVPVEKGDTAFQFVPGSADSEICAIKEEEFKRGNSTSYMQIFKLGADGTGAQVLLHDLEIPGKKRFQGFAFLE